MMLNQKADRSVESALAYLEMKQYLAESCSKVAHPSLFCSVRRGMGVRSVVKASSFPAGGAGLASAAISSEAVSVGVGISGGDVMAGCCGT